MSPRGDVGDAVPPHRSAARPGPKRSGLDEDRMQRLGSHQTPSFRAD
jgi:hypothetical protein